MKKVTNLIFSYNRACQLDAFLASFKLNYKDYKEQDNIILYKYSDENFLHGYLKCMNDHPEFIWMQEAKLKRDVDYILEFYQNSYFCMFCDDDIMKEQFNINGFDFNQFEIQSNAVCFSLRMNKDISKCHPMGNVSTPAPNFMMKDPYIWKWVDLLGDWGYPMSVDGHIFRRDFIKAILNSYEYDNVGHLEAYISTSKFKDFYPYMVCSEKSAIFNIPLNSVSPLKNINMNITTEVLNHEYLHSKSINYMKYQGYNNISPHEEVPLYWK